MAKIAEVQEVTTDKLRPYEHNAKKHGRDQIEKLKASIREFGFLTPCLIDREFNLIAGHGRVAAAEQLKRRCRIMELDPHYCDVIINRWEEFTGGKAVRIDG